MGKVAAKKNTALFTDSELDTALAGAFTMACWPVKRPAPTAKRLAYLTEAASEIVSRLQQSVTDGDIGRHELGLVLIGAALASHRMAIKGGA